MDIYTLIHDDHEAARKIIEQIEASSSYVNRLSLFHKLRMAVVAHNDAEAGSFYVALEAHAATRQIAARSRTEHEEADTLMDDLRDTSMAQSMWEGKFAELKRALMEHIEKEETHVFAAARRVLSAKMAAELADAMQQLKLMRERLIKQAS